jgi:hypothetical protein
MTEASENPLPPETMGDQRRPVSQTARDRLRSQARRERELAARVAAAESRLTVERRRRRDAITDLDRAVARREAEVADALVNYVDADGVGIDRAAIILGRARNAVAKTVRTRRAELRTDSARRTSEPKNTT